MKYLLGIDFGGGASKATLISHEGDIVATSAAEYPTLYPEAGAAEQDPRHWIDALIHNTKNILCKSGIAPEDISAVAVDSATHTFLACDENFKPLANAIHWTDTRSRKEAEYLKETFGDMIFERTYHRPDTIWTLPQLLWLKNKRPEISERLGALFFEKDYVRFYLTGVFCTDFIEAEGSMLYNCKEGVWDEELCALCGISPKALPPIVKPRDIVGAVTHEAAESTGLAAGTPVICGTTDTALEILASGSVNKGDITVKLATAGRICVITDRAYPSAHLVNYSHVKEGLWYPGTATKAAASSLRWYRDIFGKDYESINAEAKTVPPGSEGLIYHPYLKGELTPYGDPTLCGSFTGMRATHSAAHFSRAVMEGVAFSLLDCKLYLDTLGISYNSVACAIGGGAEDKLWRQILADVLGIALKVNERSDSSLGSCMLAGIALGIFSDENDAVAKCVRVKDITYPDKQRGEIYRRIFSEYKEIEAALAPIYNKRG